MRDNDNDDASERRKKQTDEEKKKIKADNTNTKVSPAFGYRSSESVDCELPRISDPGLVLDVI